MLDIRFVRENPEIVRENIRKKFQDAKLPLVDEVLALDAKNRAAITEASDLRAKRNQLSKANGPLFGRLKKAAEADRAAAYITELVRDKGFRYRDITVICNDMDVRGSVLRRTFERWGIPAFADRKRKVLHQPVVRFLLSLLHIIAEGYTDTAVMEPSQATRRNIRARKASSSLRRTRRRRIW